MSKHTPGPWVARPDPHGNPADCCIGLPDDVTPPDYVAVCHERDGQLIAAAPEMLEALRTIAGLSMSQFYKPQDLGNAAIRLASIAVVKATGELP